MGRVVLKGGMGGGGGVQGGSVRPPPPGDDLLSKTLGIGSPPGEVGAVDGMSVSTKTLQRQ